MLITMDKAELKQWIAEEVAKQNNNRNKQVYCDEWKELRKEIDQYCHNSQSLNRSYQTLQNFIYSAIKLTTGISRLTEMTPEKVSIAKETFAFLKQKRIECELNEKPIDYMKQFNKEVNF